jgi:hypothetical protein
MKGWWVGEDKGWVVGHGVRQHSDNLSARPCWSPIPSTPILIRTRGYTVLLIWSVGDGPLFSSKVFTSIPQSLCGALGLKYVSLSLSFQPSEGKIKAWRFSQRVGLKRRVHPHSVIFLLTWFPVLGGGGKRKASNHVWPSDLETDQTLTLTGFVPLWLLPLSDIQYQSKVWTHFIQGY